jgi:predicted HicB family RNase H-like nuclease
MMKSKTTPWERKMNNQLQNLEDLINKYYYQVTWDDEDKIFIARVVEFPSLAAHGDSHLRAIEELKLVVQAVIEDLQENNEPLPQPLSTRAFSGRFNVRIPVSLHRQLAISAEQQGVSLNQLVLHKLSR